jgi:predicted MFS family arabinose efflux permease
MARLKAETVGRPSTCTEGNSETHWAAVYAMALCSFALVTSEFLPVSLLSPIASTLHLSEGRAGQAVSVAGVFAVFTSLSITILIGRFDRRHILLVLIGLLTVSSTTVALAPNYWVLMSGRALLGIGIGGFWSMSASIVMRLVPGPSVAKALATINGGNALAVTVAAPLGSFVGGLIGWRGAFYCTVPVAAAAVLCLALALPPLPVTMRNKRSGTLSLLRHRQVAFGMTAITLLFVGHFGLLTYLRPFLEQVTHADVPTVSLMFLIVGASGFVGTMLVSRAIERNLRSTQCILPTVMAAVAIGLAGLGHSTILVAILLAVWGCACTAAPVGWWTWLARTVPNNAEAGGGLMVGVVQIAITLGAAIGGVVFDGLGPVLEFRSSGAVLGFAAIAALVGAQVHSIHGDAAAGKDEIPLK